MNNKKMFKMSWKRILSVLLVVTLISGLCTQVLKAEQSPTMVNSLYFTDIARENSSSTGIYAIFEADDLSGLTADPNWTNRFKPADAGSGIFVNGSETAVAYPSSGGYAYQTAVGAAGIYLEQFGALGVGEYLTVKGTFISESTGESFTLLKAMRFTWMGDTDKWVVSYETEPATNVNKLYLTDGAKNASNPNGIYAIFEAADLSGLTMNEWNNRFRPADANSGIFVNGNQTAAAYPVEQGGYAYQNAVGEYGIYLEGFGTLEVDDYLIVKGTFVSDSTGESFTILDETRFTWKGETDKWVVSYETEAATNVDKLYLTDIAKEANTQTGIYAIFEAADLSGLTADPDWNNRFIPADANSGIFVNGSQTAVAYPSNGGYAYQNATGAAGIYLEQFGTLDVGDYLTVEGTFYSESTGESFTLLKATRFTWMGDTDKWAVSYEDDEQQPDDTPSEVVIPTDVTFEDLAQTKKVNTVEVASKTDGTLGALADITHGFKFKLSSITTANAGKEIKIGLYNPTNSVWNGGYFLRLIPAETQGTVDWALIDVAADKQIAFGTLTDVPETMEVYAWASNITSSGYTLNFIADAQLHFLQEMDGSVELGKNLYVYNGWESTAVIDTFDQYVEEPDDTPTEVVIPTDVTFEDLAKTKKANTVEVASKAEGTLGALADITHGFKFKLSSIEAANVGKEIKIGLYNPTNSVWNGGYFLRLIPAETQGTVDWALIDTVADQQIAFGTITDVSETMEVYAWVSDITSSGHTLNIIILAGGQLQFSQTMDGSVELGKNLYVYNGWESTAVIHTFDQYVLEPEDTPTDVSIPTNVTFEDLAKTKKVNTVEVASKDEGTLGTLADITHGFKFKLSSIKAANAGKEIKIGLYNPSESMWTGGYHLRLIPAKAQGTVEWAIIDAVADKQIAFGAINDASETMEIYVWASNITSSGHTLNIIADGQMMISQKMDGSVKLGKNLYVYNGWGSTAVFHTYDKYVKEEVKLPTNVTFEDLAQTAQANTIEVSAKKEGALGMLADVTHGFKFKLSNITTANAGKEIKIGLYNPGESVWTGGYHLRLIPQTSQGTVEWAVLNAVADKQIAFGAITGAAETMEVYAWVSDITSSGHTLNIMANGQMIFSQKMDGSIKLGKNLYAYNGWDSTAVFHSFDKYVKQEVKLPSNVIFEDLSKTAQVNTVEVPAKKEGSLGTLADIANGFKFKISGMTVANVGKEVKVALYNPTDSIWNGGYHLRLTPQAAQGTVEWAIINPVTEAQLAFGIIANVPETMEVYAWVSNITSSGHTLNIIANGQMIFSKAMGGSVELGKKLYAYNGWDNAAVFHTFDEVVIVKANIPTDITFEDIGSASLKKEINVPSNTYVTLAVLSSEKNGFQFLMNTPEGTDYGRSMKIGLYNTDYYPWANGYILRVCPNEDGSTLFSLLRGKDEALCAVVPAFTGVKHGETFQITVWISSDASKPGAHTVHIVLNDIELLTYTCEDGGVLLGRHVTVYSEWETTVAIRAVSDTETLEERYLRLFGDPTAMTGTSDAADVIGKQVWIFVLGGVVVVALAAVSVTLLLKKRKKQQ